MLEKNGIADGFSYRISFNELAITRSTLSSLMGYKPGTLPEPLPEMIDEAISLAADYCDINGGLIIKDKLCFNKDDHILSVDDVAFNLQTIVYNQLKKAEKIAVFACTAGPAISDLSKKLLAEGDLTTGYIMDIIGSAVVETAMDRIQIRLSSRMTALGLNISNRYSPGYCDWDVSEQHKLFSLLSDHFCGIELSDVALMYPIKSVSGFIGIGGNIRYHDYPCNHCKRHNCLYRDRNQKGL